MKHKAIILAGLVVLSGLAAATPNQAANESDKVRVSIDAPPVAQQALQMSEGVRHDFDDVFTTTVSTERFEQLKNLPGVTVSKVEKVTLYHHKPGHEKGSGNTDDGSSDRTTPRTQIPYGIEQIYNDSSLESTSGGSGVDVAVLDTGVDTDHPDLVNRIEECARWWTHPSPNKGGFDDGNCEDGSGHGTHVSGTVLADAGNDGKGIYGVAPEADLHAYKVLNDDGSGYADDIADAIHYAANHDAEIISMSLGTESQSSLIANEIEAHDDEVLFVAAAGNSGPELDTMGYPGANSNTVGVGALNSNYKVPNFASRGIDVESFQEATNYMEVAAAGANVLSTVPDGGYDDSYSGTSMATPHISGFAAKAWASGAADLNEDGTVTSQEAREFIRNNADKDITKGTHAGTGYDPAAGLGLPTVS